MSYENNKNDNESSKESLLVYIYKGSLLQVGAVLKNFALSENYHQLFVKNHNQTRDVLQPPPQVIYKNIQTNYSSKKWYICFLSDAKGTEKKKPLH